MILNYSCIFLHFSFLSAEHSNNSWRRSAKTSSKGCTWLMTYDLCPLIDVTTSNWCLVFIDNMGSSCQERLACCCSTSASIMLLIVFFSVLNPKDSLLILHRKRSSASHCVTDHMSVRDESGLELHTNVYHTDLMAGFSCSRAHCVLAHIPCVGLLILACSNWFALPNLPSSLRPGIHVTAPFSHRLARVRDELA